MLTCFALCATRLVCFVTPFPQYLIHPTAHYSRAPAERRFPRPRISFDSNQYRRYHFEQSVEGDFPLFPTTIHTSPPQLPHTAMAMVNTPPLASHYIIPPMDSLEWSRYMAAMFFAQHDREGSLQRFRHFIPHFVLQSFCTTDRLKVQQRYAAKTVLFLLTELCRFSLCFTMLYMANI